MKPTEIIANLHVADIDAARGFYTDYLGLEEESFNLGWVAHLRSSDDRACVQLVTGDASSPEDSVISVRVGDQVDEAYADFSETNCLALVARSDKIMVSRSLSKSYALAGLRFGFLVAQPHLIEQFVKVKDSYNVGALDIAGATAAIDDTRWLADNRAKIVKTRRRLTDGMRQG